MDLLDGERPSYLLMRIQLDCPVSMGPIGRTLQPDPRKPHGGAEPVCQ